jgi:predicted amidohydrolase
MHAHLVQFDIAWEQPRENFSRVRRALGIGASDEERASGPRIAPGDLVVLPEMFDTGFSLDAGRTHDESGTTLAFLCDLARTLRCTVHGSRTLRTPDGRGRNMASVVGPDGVALAEYAKIHPFLGTEAERFAPGTDVTTYTWTPPNGPSVAVGVAICYDLRFPELFRRLALPRDGRPAAEVIAIGANWPVSRAHHWRALLIARAIENQAYVLGVNRVGRDPNLAYNGGSIAVGPKGDVLGELDDREGVLSVEIDPGVVRQWRGSFPALRDARMV